MGRGPGSVRLRPGASRCRHRVFRWSALASCWFLILGSAGASPPRSFRWNFVVVFGCRWLLIVPISEELGTWQIFPRGCSFWERLYRSVEEKGSQKVGGPGSRQGDPYVSEGWKGILKGPSDQLCLLVGVTSLETARNTAQRHPSHLAVIIAI